MSSNYNYNYIAQLNSLNPVPAPEMSDEDLARELEFWSNTSFIEVPPGLLDDEFSTIDTKLDQNVTQPTMMVQHDLTTLTDQTQTQQTLHYPLFFPTPNSLVPNRLQPVTIATSSNDNFTPIFSATPIAPVNVPTNVVNNSVILSKETQENTPSSTPTTTDPTSTVSTKTTTKTTTSTNTTPSSTSGPSRKNSSSKSNQSSTSETTQSGSTETKEGEKDAEKLAAEEDKRRRNTAASARFRVKKKMREQALERTAREMTAKAEMFEGRVKELEMEIKWLRSLIVEKDARLLDVERPGKRKKKAEIDDDDDDDDDDDEKEEVKREQNDQTKKKE